MCLVSKYLRTHPERTAAQVVPIASPHPPTPVYRCAILGISLSHPHLHQTIYIYNSCQQQTTQHSIGSAKPPQHFLTKASFIFAKMVSTRASSSRPGSPAPATPASPTRSAKRSASRRRSKSTSRPPTTSRRSVGASSSSSSSSSPSGWSHTPDPPTLFWLAVSLPLVIWDTIYVLGRPHTMEDGWMHWPLWTPYKLYGEVDHVYGWKAFHARSGFTAAQGMLNVFETGMYLAYWYVFFTRAKQFGKRKALVGRPGAQAVLIGFSAAVMTLSKTVLYCKFP